MLSPLTANPFLLMAPVFWVGLFWIAYGDLGVAFAAASRPECRLPSPRCASKALEIVAFLRLAPRSRGAVLGIVSWLGQVAYMVMVFAAFTPGPRSRSAGCCRDRRSVPRTVAGLGSGLARPRRRGAASSSAGSRRPA